MSFLESHRVIYDLFSYSLKLCLFLREHANTEVSIHIGFEGGGHDDVLSRGQTESRAHLSQVDEGLGASRCSVPHKEVTIQMDVPLADKLGSLKYSKTIEKKN